MSSCHKHSWRLHFQSLLLIWLFCRTAVGALVGAQRSGLLAGALVGAPLRIMARSASRSGAPIFSGALILWSKVNMNECMNHSHWTIKSQVKKVAKKTSVIGFLKRCYMQKSLDSRPCTFETEEVKIGFWIGVAFEKRNGLFCKS